MREFNLIYSNLYLFLKISVLNEYVILYTVFRLAHNLLVPMISFWIFSLNNYIRLQSIIICLLYCENMRIWIWKSPHKLAEEPSTCDVMNCYHDPVVWTFNTVMQVWRYIVFNFLNSLQFGLICKYFAFFVHYLSFDD